MMSNELTYRTASVFQGDEILRMSEYMRDKPLKPREGQVNVITRVDLMAFMEELLGES